MPSLRPVLLPDSSLSLEARAVLLVFKISFQYGVDLLLRQDDDDDDEDNDDEAMRVSGPRCTC